MRDADFDRTIEALQQQVSELQECKTTDSTKHAEVLPEAFEELQTTLEELQVTEEELRQQNEALIAARQIVEAERQRYQELFDFAPDGYLVTDAAGNIQEVNRAAAVLLAVSQNLLIGKPLIIFVAEEERKRFHTQLLQLSGLERVQDWEVRLQPRRGTPFHATITAAAVRDPQGKLVGLRWLLRDISIRKALSESIERLHARLVVEQQRLQSLVQHLPEGVALLDTDRRLVLANPAALSYLAVLTEAAVGERVSALGEQPVEQFSTPRPEGLPHEVLLAGPPRRVFEIQTNPITEGPEGGWVLLIRDVTAERAVQQQIEQQGRLAAVGQLAAGIAHDFNNLLTVVIGYADLLKVHADLPESVTDNLDIIAQQGRRGAHLVRQILDFSRQSLVQPHPLDLLPVLKETCKLLQRTLPESIHVVLESVPGDYLINADGVQIQQLLTNLAVNAHQAMPDGGKLRFHLSQFTLSPGKPRPCPDMPTGRWAVLAVLDTGRGMPSEVLRHIFEPFFTTKEIGQGAGLGLAQVYGIVKQHHGHITVQSQSEHGTTFTLYLPTLAAPAEAAGDAAPQAIPRGQGETLLLVEDEPQVMELLRTMLERLHYRVLTAPNGQEALTVYEHHSDAIALVLTDLIMPDIGGLALFHTLRQRDPGAKVIVLTGYALGEETHDLLAQGIMDWLQKPPELPVLAQAVRRALEGQRVEQTEEQALHTINNEELSQA
jgi:PAS domain S-box-containing protein